MTVGWRSFLAGVAAGAAAAAAAALSLSARHPAPAAAATPAPAADPLADLDRRVEDAVARALRRGRAAPPPPPAAAPSSGDAPAEPVRGPATRPSGTGGPDPSRDPPEVAAFARDLGSRIPPKDLSRLGGLVVRSRDQEARRHEEWMFVSERALVEALGPPDAVDPQRTGHEHWRYDVPRPGDPSGEHPLDVRFTLYRGRVVEVCGAELE